MGWHTLLYVLADGDVVKFEKLLTMNGHLLLTHKLFENGHKKIVEWIKGRK